MARSRTLKAAILASGQALTACASLIIFAVLSRVFSVGDYATYRQTILAYGFAAPLLMLGLPNALYYFLPGEKERARGVLLENLLLLSCMGVVFSLFLLLGGNQLLAWRFHNPELERTLLVLAPYPLFMLPVTAVSSCLMARDRVKLVALFNIISRLVTLVVVLGVVVIWPSPQAAIIATVVAAVIVLFPALHLMLGAVTDGSSRIRMTGLVAQMKFSVPVGLASMIGAISYALDKIIVSSMCPPEQFAVYANGAFEIPLIAVITGSVSSVLFPEISAMNKAGDQTEALELWKRGALKCAIIIYPLFFVLLVMAPDLVVLMFSSKYAASALPFRLYLAMLPIRIAVWGVMFMSMDESRLILVKVAVGFVANLVLSLAFVYLWGYIGAVIGTILALYLWNVPFNLVMIAKLYKKRLGELLPYRKLVKIAVLSAVASGACLVGRLVPGSGEMAALVRLGVCVPLFVVVVLALFLRFGVLDLNRVLTSIRGRFS